MTNVLSAPLECDKPSPHPEFPCEFVPAESDPRRESEKEEKVDAKAPILKPLKFASVLDVNLSVYCCPAVQVETIDASAVKS